MNKILEDCCSSLKSSVELLNSTNTLLVRSNEYSEALCKGIFQTRRVFEAVPEYDVQRAKLDLIEDLEPLVRLLEDHARRSLGKMSRELDTLRQTREYQRLRAQRAGSADTSGVVLASLTDDELESLRKLRAQRQELTERLKQVENGDMNNNDE